MIEMFSPSGKYKTVIEKYKERYKITVFVKKEDYDHYENISYGEYWSRISNNIILVNTVADAKFRALELIRDDLGEPRLEMIVEWVSDYINSKEVKLLDLGDVEVFVEDHTLDGIIHEKIEAQEVILIDEVYCIVKGIDNCYLVGQIEGETVLCWYYVDNLREGLKAL